MAVFMCKRRPAKPEKSLANGAPNQNLKVGFVHKLDQTKGDKE
jgi:hypothetical protein